MALSLLMVGAGCHPLFEELQSHHSLCLQPLIVFGGAHDYERRTKSRLAFRRKTRTLLPLHEMET